MPFTHYDYLIVGAGLFGSTFAYEMNRRQKKCMVIDKRNHAGGNIYCTNEEGINVHQYGAHIFHTNDESIWKYVNKFVSFFNYINSPLACNKGRIYNLPFNMNTFNQLWGLTTPNQAQKKIQEQTFPFLQKNPKNLEEQALSLVGPDIYNTFIKEYSEKQWGRKPTELPSFLIKRVPLRFTYDNNYFNDKYQGIPIGGYNTIINKLLTGVEVRLNIDYLNQQDYWNSIAKKIVFSGPIDAFFDYKLGRLEYRSLSFAHERMDIPDFQGNAVVNYIEKDIPYTRIIEHKHFEFGNQLHTIITKEYPTEAKKNSELFYPINDEKNNRLYTKYKEMSVEHSNVIFGGRLGNYRYYDMHQVIASALKSVQKEIQKT